MKTSINSVTVSGHLTHDAELKRTQSGYEILSFSVAVNEAKKSQTGEWESYPNYIKCTLFGTRAVKLESILSKGSKVVVMGKIHQNRWQDSDGKSKSEIIINVNEIEFMSKAKEGNQPTKTTYSSNFHDDLPF